MKRILLLLVAFISLTACSQNQTFTGIKTFNSPPKFKNLQNNETNTKVLTVNSNDVLQWKSASSFTSSVPTINQVLQSGNSSFNSLNFAYQGNNLQGLTITSVGFDIYNNANGSAYFKPQGIFVNDNINGNFSLSPSDGFNYNSVIGQAFALNHTHLLLRNITFDNFITLNNPSQDGHLNFKLPVKPNGFFELGTKEDIDLAKRPYKVYTAYISQTGTGDPVATVLENTFSGSIVWARAGVGYYTATLTGAFVDTFKCYSTDSFNHYNNNQMYSERSDNNTFDVYSYNSSNAATDGLLSLNKFRVEIRVYN